MAVGGVLAALGVAATAGYTRTRRLVNEAERRFPPVGEFVEVEGVRLHHVCRGEGLPVVLLHGNPGFVYDYALTVLERLAQEFRACAFDRPGHGYSQRPTGDAPTAETQARLLRDALEALEIDRPILVGHSWSGAMILAYALQYPEEVRGLVLLGAVSHPRPVSEPVKNALLATPVVGDLIRWSFWTDVARRRVQQNLETAYAPGPVRPDHAEAAVALWSRPGQVRSAAQDFLTVETSLARLVPRYHEIKIPVVVVVGDDDPWIDPDLHAYPLLDKVANGTLVRLARTGHEIAHTRPDDVVEAIRKATTNE